VTRDLDVEPVGHSLDGRRILLGVSGGIAAVDTVRVARELRRHGAEVLTVMTRAAQRVITPLAVRWATDGTVITDWEGDMAQLEGVDGVLVAPATRNTIAAHLHGLQHGPLLMAMSAARARGTPLLVVPSMHHDLADDPVTEDLVEAVQAQGATVLWGPSDEGRRKTPDHVAMVARLCHLVNAQKPHRRSVAVTLGATVSPIDDVRSVVNTSTGKTGWAIADDLYRHGHDVTCISGRTSAPQPSWLPLVLPAQGAPEMLEECLAVAKDGLDAWVHAAAVLDYLVPNAAEGKLASGSEGLRIDLVPGPKHIDVLREACPNAVRIGFKLESGIPQRELVQRAHAQVKRAGMTAVIANRLEDLGREDRARAYLVDASGSDFALHTERDMVDAIRHLVERGA
jgi:phosphopantothenoylcysteine decarboxylase/phosphopantothenate--cysteine ligase